MTDTKSPNLEVISNPAATPEDPAERRRLPRLNLSGEQFRLVQNGKVFSVTDLSDAGLAFRILDPTDLVLFSVGAVFDGVLNLRGEKHVFKAKVRHIRVDLVGCQFLEVTEAMREELQRFLDPEVLGRELKPSPPIDAGTIWYHGPSGTDFVLLRGIDGQTRRFTLHVLGAYVQWDRELGLATGLGKPSQIRSENQGAMRFETLLLEPDAKLDPGKLAIAKKVLMSSNLPQDLMKWCVRHLLSS